MPELLDTIDSALADLAIRLADRRPDTPAPSPESTEAQPLQVIDIHETVIRLQRAASAMSVVSARALSQWDDERAWVGRGHRTAAHRLAREGNRNIRRARHELWRAHQLEAMPHAQQAILDGRLSIDHVDLLGRANRPWNGAMFAQHEAFLVEQCAELTWEPASRVVDYWIQHADAIAAQQAGHLRSTDVHCWASTTLGGSVVVDALLDPIGGAIVTTELDRLERELWLLDQASGNARTPRQRRAAALVEMAIRSAAMPEGARRPKPLFTVLVGDHTTRHLCELATSRTVLDPTELRQHLDTAVIESVIFDGPLEVLSVSRQRTFTGALRRAIEVRDRNCQHPSGCDTAAHRCDVDHIEPWSTGGTTHQRNGRLLCAPHNRHPDLRGPTDANADPRHPHRDDLPDRARHRRLGITRARLRWRELQHTPT